MQRGVHAALLCIHLLGKYAKVREADLTLIYLASLGARQLVMVASAGKAVDLNPKVKKGVDHLFAVLKSFDSKTEEGKVHEEGLAKLNLKVLMSVEDIERFAESRRELGGAHQFLLFGFVPAPWRHHHRSWLHDP